MVNQEQILSHLLTTVLKLDTEDIKAISNARYRKYSKFVNVTCNVLDRLRDKEDPSSCAWRELTDWMMYSNATSPSYANIMTMTCNTWNSIDRNMLRINRVLTKTTVATIKLLITAATVSSSQIDAISFLKYVSIHLIDKSQILNFYQNLATQATSHNVFICPYADITVQKGIIPDGMLPES